MKKKPSKKPAPVKHKAAPPAVVAKHVVRAPTGTPKLIELKRLHASPLNPRKTMGSLADVTGSFKTVGQISPLLVRPHAKKAGDFEVVCGHRRRAAGVELKWTHLLCVVRDLSDREAIECMLVENTARADVPPLEEAEAYAALHSPPHNLSVEEIAARVGKSESHVYQRIRVSQKLVDAGKKAVASGKLQFSGAIVVTRLEDAAEQRQAVAEIIRNVGDAGASADSARWVVGRFLRVLSNAPFDTGDAKLVPAAGACTACPKRSDKQAALFAEADDKKVARCMDGACWTKKDEVRKAAVLEKAKKTGLEVVTGKKAEELFKYGQPVRGSIDLDAECSRAQRGTWRDVLKNETPKPTIVVDEKGDLHEIVSEKLALAAAKKRGLKWAQPPSKGGTAFDDPKTARDRRERDRLEEAVGTRLEFEIGMAIAANPVAVLTDIARTALAARLNLSTWGAIEPAVRRGFTHPELEKRNRRVVDAASEHLDKFINTKQRSEGDLLALLWELCVRNADHDDSDLRELAARIPLDVSDIEARAKAQIETEKAAKKEARGGKRKAAAPVVDDGFQGEDDPEDYGAGAGDDDDVDEAA